MPDRTEFIEVLGRAERRLTRALTTVLGLGLIGMVVVNVANAIGRYGDFTTLIGADELLVFSMIWIVMLGAIVATRQRAHLSIDLLPASLAPRAARLLRAATGAVMAGVAGFVAWQSWAFIERIGALGQTSMGLGVPMVVPHAAIFVGFAGIGVVAGILTLGDLLCADRKDGE